MASAPFQISQAAARILQSPRFSPNVRNPDEFRRFKEMVGKGSGGRYEAVTEEEMEGMGIRPGQFGSRGYSLKETEFGKSLREREQEKEQMRMREEGLARLNRMNRR